MKKLLLTTLIIFAAIAAEAQAVWITPLKVGNSADPFRYARPKGSLIYDLANDHYYILEADATALTTLNTATASEFPPIGADLWYINGNYLYNLNQTDSVGINTVLPSEVFEVNGNIKVDTVKYDAIDPAVPAGLISTTSINDVEFDTLKFTDNSYFTTAAGNYNCMANDTFTTIGAPGNTYTLDICTGLYYVTGQEIMLMDAVDIGNYITATVQTYNKTTGEITIVSSDESAIFTTNLYGISLLGNSTVSSGAGAPGSPPAALGMIYIDTSTGDIYISNGIAAAGDWKKVYP